MRAEVASAVADGQIPPHLPTLIGSLVDMDGFPAGPDFTRPALHGDAGVAQCLNALRLPETSLIRSGWRTEAIERAS